MKNLVDFIKENLNISNIKEELDDAQFKKIKADRDHQKKEELVAIKKGLGKFSEEDLEKLAKDVYERISNYKDPDDLFDAFDRGDIEDLTKLNDEVKRANQNSEVDFDTLLNIIELIASGKKLDQAIVELAKKI